MGWSRVLLPITIDIIFYIYYFTFYVLHLNCPTLVCCLLSKV